MYAAPAAVSNGGGHGAFPVSGPMRTSTDSTRPQGEYGGVLTVHDGGMVHWNRVHKLPDHVFFSHQWHVKAGVACQTCHGPVQEMDRVHQYAPLTMGWCMECHRGLTTPRNVMAKIHPDLTEADLALGNHPVAATNCSTCHN